MRCNSFENKIKQIVGVDCVEIELVAHIVLNDILKLYHLFVNKTES